MKVKVGDIRRIVQEETDKLRERSRVDELYGSPHLRDVGMDRQRSSLMGRRGARGRDFELEPEAMTRPTTTTAYSLRKSLVALKGALSDVAAAKAAFNIQWYGTLCDSDAGHEMGELTMQLGAVLVPLANALKLRLKLEAADLGASPMAERVLREERLDEIGMMSSLFGRGAPKVSKGTPPVSGKTLPKITSRGVIGDEVTERNVQPILDAVYWVKPTLTQWLDAYDNFPKIRRFMCMGRSGERMAAALRKLDDVLSTINP